MNLQPRFLGVFCRGTINCGWCVLLQGQFSLCIVCEELGRASRMIVKPPKGEFGL